MGEVLTIGGVALPLDDVKSLVEKGVPALISGIRNGSDAKQIVKSLEPELLVIVEDVANAFFPGAGGAIALIGWALKHSRPMTPQEEELWFQRMTPDFNSGGG